MRTQGFEAQPSSAPSSPHDCPSEASSGLGTSTEHHGNILPQLSNSCWHWRAVTWAGPRGRRWRHRRVLSFSRSLRTMPSYWSHLDEEVVGFRERQSFAQQVAVPGFRPRSAGQRPKQRKDINVPRDEELRGDIRLDARSLEEVMQGPKC